MYGIKCHKCIEELPGGRIQTIAHMSKILSKHSLFEWENYGVAWKIDHVSPFELMDKNLVSDYFRVNNWSNLAPKTSEQNKKERYLKLGAAGAAETEAAGEKESQSY